MRLRFFALLPVLAAAALLAPVLAAKKVPKKGAAKANPKPRIGGWQKAKWHKPNWNKANPKVQQHNNVLQHSKVSRKEVQKCFVLTLAPTASVKLTKRQVGKLRFHGKNAGCLVRRFYAKLRMLSVRCAIVTSPRVALLLNGHLTKLPGVLHSTPDAFLSAEPSDSTERDDNDGNGPDTPMFRKPLARISTADAEDLAPYNWGLDRIDEDYSPLDNMPVDFSCYPKEGDGVKVFVIDTGCKVGHDEFAEANINSMPAPGSDFTNGNDDHGHGSHIAGVIVGKNVGIARRAELTCIKAFDEYGNGAATDTLSAVEYIIEQKFKNSSVPIVVNLSYSALTGFSTTPLDEMVYAVSARGIVFVVAAGNAKVNSCFFSPSKAEQALTVAASTKRDTLEVDSNIGPCVEFIAPGHEIVSAGIESKYDYESLNGTSMATPHIVGLSALVLAEFPELQYEPGTVRDKLYEKLVTSRSANVSNFIMPLMETECEAGAPRMAKRSNTNAQTEPLGPFPVTALPCVSSSPSATPSSSPFPSASRSVSPSPSQTPRPDYAAGNMEFGNNPSGSGMEEEGDNAAPSAPPGSYFQYGFGPASDPYAYGISDDSA